MVGEVFPFDPDIIKETDPRLDLMVQYGSTALNVKSRWEAYKHSFDNSPTTHDHVIDELSSILSGDETILDAGCSDGETAFRIRNEIGHSGRIVGIDIDDLSLPTVSRTAKVGMKPMEFKVESVLDIHEPDNSVDVALALFMLYHVPYQRALAELNRVLVPGGLLIVTTSETGDTYDIDNKYWHRKFEERIAKELGVVPPPKFAATFGPKEANEAMVENGFEIILHEQQLTEMVINEPTSLADYKLSMMSMASACRPAVRQSDWDQKYDELVLPEIKAAIKKHGSFRDRINRHLFIGKKIN